MIVGYAKKNNFSVLMKTDVQIARLPFFVKAVLNVPIAINCYVAAM